MKTYSSQPSLGKSVLASGILLLGLCYSAHAQYVGNDLSVSYGELDGEPPLVILGEYNPAGPLGTSSTTFPDSGNISQVEFYGSTYSFTLYALSLVGAGPNPNEQTFQVVGSESFSGSAAAGIQSLPVSGISVTAGDFLAFAGVGPYYNSSDAINSDATYEDSSNAGSFVATPPNGAAGTQFSVGVFGDAGANYEYISDVFGNQGRNYGIGVNVPDSGSALLLLVPGLAALAVTQRRWARA